jgi:glycosyltransferase involved in cell wall biosynthesis
MGAPGFDDAPIVRLPKAAGPKAVQFVYPYYDNPEFMRRHFRVWAEFPQELRAHLSAVIVDDGSPDYPASAVLKAAAPLPFRVRLFRIEVDVRWNWLAARNVAMHHVEDEWCLLTDMDHVVTRLVAEQLVHCEHDPRVIYRLSRREHTWVRIHPHPNSMFLTRRMFWKAGGYDETLSGHYGTDGDWRRRLAATAPVKTLPEELERHEHTGDSSTVRYKRKQPEDAGVKALVAARKGVRGGWRPKVLSFPYHEVEL